MPDYAGNTNKGKDENPEKDKPEKHVEKVVTNEVVKKPNTISRKFKDIFFGGDAFPRAFAEFSSGATVFAYHVHQPQRYGVVEFDANGHVLSLEEKPSNPRSHFAVPGVYICDHQAVEIARTLKPSPRGEFEITDVLNEYQRRGQLRVQRLSRGFAWLDAGTSSSLHDAASYVQTIEKRQGIKIGCPEEAALRRGFLSLAQFEELTGAMPACEYRDYLKSVAAEMKRVIP